jgi:ABC-2 type transport system ATP-binding protein
MADVIALQGLTKRFGQQTVLNGVDLDLQPGEILGLIGPSGAGKSTVIKTTLGMEVADSGIAKVYGAEMPNRVLLGQIGYMAQSNALYTTLTGRENLEFFAVMKGLPKDTLSAEIDRVARVVDLTGDLGKRVSGYSGGMMRRLSLAIALLHSPRLLVLDEPTVGIDPALRIRIWEELRRAVEAGSSVLITTHVMDEAEKCDRVALLLGGKVMAFEAPAKLEADYNVDTVEEVFLKAEGEL